MEKLKQRTPGYYMLILLITIVIGGGYKVLGAGV